MVQRDERRHRALWNRAHHPARGAAYTHRHSRPRVALAILREAREPLPIRVIAARALARKDCLTPTRRIFKMTRVRLQQLFGRLDAKGITYSVGTGSATRWGLVDVRTDKIT